MRTLFAIVLTLAVPIHAADKVYETGQLTAVKMTDGTASVTIPPLAPNAAGFVLPFPLGVTYSFTIEKDGISYLAACISKQKKSYAADWVVNDPVRFRIDKEKFFLKRPNGKEMRLALLTRVRNAMSETQTSATQMIPECK
jgi:hypothetical protein